MSRYVQDGNDKVGREERAKEGCLSRAAWYANRLGHFPSRGDWRRKEQTLGYKLETVEDLFGSYENMIDKLRKRPEMSKLVEKEREREMEKQYTDDDLVAFLVRAIREGGDGDTITITQYKAWRENEESKGNFVPYHVTFYDRLGSFKIARDLARQWIKKHEVEISPETDVGFRADTDMLESESGVIGSGAKDGGFEVDAEARAEPDITEAEPDTVKSEPAVAVSALATTSPELDVAEIEPENAGLGVVEPGVVESESEPGSDVAELGSEQIESEQIELESVLQPESTEPEVAESVLELGSDSEDKPVLGATLCDIYNFLGYDIKIGGATIESQGSAVIVTTHAVIDGELKEENRKLAIRDSVQNMTSWPHGENLLFLLPQAVTCYSSKEFIPSGVLQVTEQIFASTPLVAVPNGWFKGKRSIEPEDSIREPTLAHEADFSANESELAPVHVAVVNLLGRDIWLGGRLFRPQGSARVNVVKDFEEDAGELVKTVHWRFIPRDLEGREASLPDFEDEIVRFVLLPDCLARVMPDECLPDGVIKVSEQSSCTAPEIYARNIRKD